MLSSIQRFVPIAAWLPNYERANLRGDLTAGLTTAVMLIPQGMAYAMLAGLPPIIGLYASIVPLAIYAAFGTSRQLAVGPVAMVSLLVASGVGELADQGTEAYVAYAVLLALMVGIFQTVMGIARLGFLTNFLSHPVISGFTSAAALIIGLSQLKHLLGVNIPRSHHIHEILIHAVEQIGDVHPVTLLIGLTSVGLLVGLKKYAPTFPRALAVVVVGTLAVVALGLDETGVAIVGSVPAGFPPPSMPTLDTDVMASLLPTAITISLVGFMESISVAKAFASRNRYEIDSNQELIGLGLANVAGAFFSAYPVTGGISRTAVNAQAGAKTPLASLITAGIIALALLFFTPLFHFLPKAVLAAIIMTAVFGLLDIKEVKHLWDVKRSDLVLLAVTFVATLGLGIEIGILTGVGVSLLAFVVRTTRPHTAVLGRVPGTRAYRNIRHVPDAETWDDLLIVRMDAQFYFGNVTFLKDTLKRLESERPAPLSAVILDASSINQLDSSADAALHEIVDDYARRDIKLLFAHVKGPVRDVMRRSHLLDKVGSERFFLDVDDAVMCARATLDGGESPHSDPLCRPAPVLDESPAAIPPLAARPTPA